MTRRRPAYLADKIELERYRRRHRREAPKGCRCPFCLTDADFKALVAAALARNDRGGDEIAF